VFRCYNTVQNAAKRHNNAVAAAGSAIPYPLDALPERHTIRIQYNKYKYNTHTIQYKYNTVVQYFFGSGARRIPRGPVCASPRSTPTPPRGWSAGPSAAPRGPSRSPGECTALSAAPGIARTGDAPTEMARPRRRVRPGDPEVQRGRADSLARTGLTACALPHAPPLALSCSVLSCPSRSLSCSTPV